MLARLGLWEMTEGGWLSGGGTSRTHRIGANPEVGWKGLWSPLPSATSVQRNSSCTKPASRSCRDEQDPGFGRDGAKSASWMPSLCKALLLPPHLGVVLLTSSPCTGKYMHVRAGRMLNYGVGMYGRRFPHGQPRKQRSAWCPRPCWIPGITWVSSAKSTASCKPQILLDPAGQDISSAEGGIFLLMWLFQPISGWASGTDVPTIMAFTVGGARCCDCYGSICCPAAICLHLSA